MEQDRAADRRYEKLLENAADVILVLDATGRLAYASPSAARVLGYEPESRLGEDVLSLIHPDDAARVIEAFRAAQAEPGVHAWIPLRVRHADGSWRDVEAASNVLLDEPSIAGIVVNLRDVTDRRRAEAERTALLGLLSHDLRTPLAVVIGRAQLLARRVSRRGAADPAALLEDAAMIERTARRMDSMLEELVDLAHLRQGEPLLLATAPLDLTALLDRLVAERRELSPRHELRLEAAAEPVVGTWDESRLARAIANLLGNATKYSPAGSTVTVRLTASAASDGDQAELVIEDTGIGIPAADLPHVGEPYYRAANAVRHGEGTGLGLFGVRRIVEQHGGALEIASEEGRGTRVTLRLLLAAPDE